MTTKNDDARAERLKAALRENLRRRKGQVRGREAIDPPKEPQDDACARSDEQEAMSAKDR